MPVSFFAIAGKPGSKSICWNMTSYLIRRSYSYIINYSYASSDLSIITFSNAFFQEATVRLDPSFFHFLKENPVVTLPAERTRTINGLIIALEDLYKDKENCFRLQILRSYTQSFLLDIYDKTHCIFKQNHPGGINR